jgi:hypothetical protein
VAYVVACAAKKDDGNAAGASNLGILWKICNWSSGVRAYSRSDFWFYIWSHMTRDGEGIDGIQYIHTPDDYFKWSWRLSRT